MTHYRLARSAPHLYIHVEDDLTERKLGRALGGLHDDIFRLPSRAAIHIESAACASLPLSSIGVLYYYLALLFDSNPSLVVFSGTNGVMQKTLKDLTGRLDHKRRARFVSSRAEANRLLLPHMPTRPHASRPASRMLPPTATA